MKYEKERDGIYFWKEGANIFFEDSNLRDLFSTKVTLSLIESYYRSLREEIYFYLVRSEDRDDLISWAYEDRLYPEEVGPRYSKSYRDQIQHALVVLHARRRRFQKVSANLVTCDHLGRFFGVRREDLFEIYYKKAGIFGFYGSYYGWEKEAIKKDKERIAKLDLEDAEQQAVKDYASQLEEGLF